MALKVEIYIRHLCKSVVSNILKLLDELGEELGLQILPTAGLDNGGENILEESGRPDIVLGTGNMGNTFFEKAHAQCQNSDLKSLTQLTWTDLRAHKPEKRHRPGA